MQLSDTDERLGELHASVYSPYKRGKRPLLSVNPSERSRRVLGVNIFNHTLDPNIVLAWLVWKIQAYPIEQPVVALP